MLLFLAAPAAAQSGRASVQLRLGALYSTPLVKDGVSSLAVDTAIPGARSQGITLRQQLAPIGTLAVRFPVKPKAQLELSVSVARAQVEGDDGLVTWDVASATIANVAFGFGYLYRKSVTLHGGVGATRIFTAERGIFARGNSIKPLLEVGAATSIPLGGRALDFDARVQSHSFGTATLRDNGGSDGTVLRAIVQVGTTLWRGRAQ